MMDWLPAVRIVDHDPAWAEQFQVLAGRALRALGDLALGVEHVGSTAVPGLAAKPVVDLDVVLRREADLPEALRALHGLGYVHLGERGVPGRHSFRWPAGEPKHHLYLCLPGSVGLREHVAFRDALRRDGGLAQRYANLKRSLAERFPDDSDAYCEAKTEFIRGVLAAAGAGDTAT